MVTLLASILPSPPPADAAPFSRSGGGHGRPRAFGNALSVISICPLLVQPAPLPPSPFAAYALCNFLVRSALTATAPPRRALGTRLALTDEPQRPRGLSVRFHEETLNAGCSQDVRPAYSHGSLSGLL